MIDVTSFLEYLTQIGYTGDKEMQRRHIWLCREMSVTVNDLCEGGVVTAH